MFVIQKIRKTVTRIDMFSSSEILRYNEDAHYHTFTGGLISLGIIFTVIAGFFSMISETMNRTAITANVNTIVTSSPSPYSLKANIDNMFMFGVQIQSTNLSFTYDFNGPRRYFDLSAKKFVLSYGIVSDLQQVTLVQCTDQHWKMLPELVQNKDQTMYNTWLCPPIDSQYLLQGSFFSPISSSVLIGAQKCTNESNPSRPCYPQDQIDKLFTDYNNFYFTVNYINTVVNHNEVTYLSYYLQSMDYAIFSAVTGSELYYMFSDYEVETDTSIWPFSSYQYKKGALVHSRVSAKPYIMGSSPTYAVAYFSKATQSLKYHRQVQKLSLVISYIGGLVGAISSILFILKIYTDLSLQIAIARNIFTLPQNQQPTENKQIIDNKTQNGNTQNKKEKEKIKKKQFNILIFLKLHVYKLLNGFKFTENWTEAKQIEMLREEIGKHLDVKILLQRLTNIQRCLSFLFDENQLKSLRYLKKTSLNEVKAMRTAFSNEVEQQQQVIEQSQTLNQLYTMQNNSDLIKKNNFITNFNQIVSPAHLSSVKNQISSNILDNSKRVNFKKQQSMNLSQNPLQHHINNEVFQNKKSINFVINLQKMKQTNILSMKIWQNLDSNIKEQLININGKKQAYIKNSHREKKKSYLKVQLPSIIVDKSN